MHRAAAVAAALLLGAPARAQLAVDQLELVLAPGVPSAAAIAGAITGGTAGMSPVGAFTVANDGATLVQATLRVQDWDRTELGDNRFFPTGTLAGSCGDRIQVFPRALRLEPHASQSVRVTASGDVPTACWAVVFVETTEPHVVGGRTINYVLRTGVKIYVEPPGLRRDGVVEAMRVDSTTAARELQVAFLNTGGVHLVARGTVEIRRPDNSVAATVAVPDLHVLPGARRRVSVPLPALAAGRYVALALLDYGGIEIAAGQIDVEAR